MEKELNERARRVRLAGRYRERKSNFDLIHGQMIKIAHTHTHTHTERESFRVLNLQVLLTGCDSIDVLAGTAGSSLVGKVSQFCKRRLSDSGEGNGLLMFLQNFWKYC